MNGRRMTSCIRFRFDVVFSLVVAGDFGDVTCVVCDVAFDVADVSFFVRDVAFAVVGAAVVGIGSILSSGDVSFVVVCCCGATTPVGYVAL